ncbi:MAG: glycoside hydrolase family 9 protein [Oscillospiraceae bacterium]
MKERILSIIMSMVVLISFMPSVRVFSANVEETSGTQLQTILIDNDGKNSWVTESWGGVNIIPNTSWTTSDMYDYFYNGTLSFEVKSNGQTSFPFRIGITSHSHNEDVTLNWTDIEKYKDNIVASPDWTSYTLSLNELVQAFTDKNFDKSNVWKINVGSIKSGESATFRNVKISSNDEERQYPYIKVNQVGYTCNGNKNAKVSCFKKFGSLNGKRFEIVNQETEEVVFSDVLSNATTDTKISGEDIYEINFNSVTQQGTYYIRIPDANLNVSALTPRDKENNLKTDTLISVTFKIGDDIYNEMLSDMSKYYYYQRQGLDLQEKYAQQFARENLHPNDISVKRWSDRNNLSAETFDVSQGWYDAGDYGKYVSPAATSVENLLLAYELFPQEFKKINPNIPETDKTSDLYSNAPAILSEIKWELDMLLKLEHSNKDGSFYVAANYKDGTMYIEDTLYSTSDYNSSAKETDLRSHLATVDMSAMLAHAYIVYKDIPEYSDFAEQCLETSIRAWNWANNPVNEKHMSIGAGNRTYTFTQEDLDRSMYWAAGTLFRASKFANKDCSEYENYLISNCENENVNTCFTGNSLGYSHKGRSFLGFFHYLYQNDNPSNQIKAVFSKFEPWRNRILNYDSFGTDYPEWGYWWGSNMVLAQSSMTLFLGSVVLEGIDNIPIEVLNSNQSAFNYLLGVNPISFSYVSGYGENSVKNIYSAIYSKDAKLTPYQCPKGYVTEGANSSNNRHLSKYNGKCYMDSDAEWTTNENTIYGNAAMIFLTSAIMLQTTPDLVTGDVNADNKFNILDIILLKKWLLDISSTELANWKSGDLNHDDTLNILDLSIIKQKFIKENSANISTYD